MFIGITDRASWVIGNTNEKTADNHIGRVLRVFEGKDDRGNEGEVASVLLQRKTLEGREYLQVRNILTRYLFDRAEIVPGFDDVSVASLSEQMAKDLVTGYKEGRIQSAPTTTPAAEAELPF